MHIHAAAIQLHPMNPYAAASEHVVAAQRAAEVRKQRLKAAHSADPSASPEVTLPMGRWLSQPQNQALPGDEYHAGVRGKDPDFA